ncbi:hypothetical protein ACIPSE_27215 [Streptomyces sp. NPDC090106]
MTYPAYHSPASRPPAHHGTDPLTFVLLIAAPAIVAVAALRPR